jgi:hypothetical protein
MAALLTSTSSAPVSRRSAPIVAWSVTSSRTALTPSIAGTLAGSRAPAMTA